MILFSCKKKDKCETCHERAESNCTEKNGCYWAPGQVTVHIVSSNPFYHSYGTEYEGECNCLPRPTPLQKLKKNVPAWNFRDMPDNESDKTLGIDKLDRIWISSEHLQKTEYYNGTTWKNADIYYGATGQFSYATQFSALPSNKIWASTGFMGLAYIDGNNLGNLPKWTTYGYTNSGINSENLTCVAAESDTQIWVGTRDRGLTLFNKSQWKTFTTSNSNLAWDEITGISIDPAGRKWLVTKEGLAVYDGINFTNIDLPGDNYTCIAIDKTGAVWTGQQPYADITVYRGGEVKLFNSRNSGLEEGGIYSMAVAPNGTLWVGTHSGLYAFENHDMVQYIPENKAEVGTYIYDIAIDNNGTVWMLTELGCAWFKP